MKKANRKIKVALLILFISLIALISFSKMGILFSNSSEKLITVSTSNKTFDSNKYMASVINFNNITTTMTTQTTTTTVTTTTTTTESTTTTKYNWDGPVLTKSKGVVQGPSGKETYYNLNMNGIVNIMRSLGYNESEYPYWVRDDGVKMLGNYVMVAANYEIRPKGTIIETSLGYGIVCDTGGFAKSNPTQLDIAVTWR